MQDLRDGVKLLLCRRHYDCLNWAMNSPWKHSLEFGRIFVADNSFSRDGFW